MKKSLLVITVFLLTSILSAQSNPIDELFNKYSDVKGFTSVYISGKMLNMLGGLEAKDNPDNLMLRISSIRILTENDSISDLKVNLYNELSKKLDFSVYEELMVVKDANEITKFLTRQKGNTISELLVITGGKTSNTLISIRGDINLKDLSNLSKTVGIDELEQLDNINKQKPGK
jgi:hypothetical protein